MKLNDFEILQIAAISLSNDKYFINSSNNNKIQRLHSFLNDFKEYDFSAKVKKNVDILDLL